MARGGRGARAIALAAAVALATPLVLLAAGVEMPGTQPADGSGAPGFPPLMNGVNPGFLQDPGRCDNCHSVYRLDGETIHEPWDTWSASMMANAARDPMFWAALDVANQDDAALGDVGVGDFCLRCHVPKAWYEGRSSCATAWGEEFDGACMTGDPSTPDNDFEGITCHFCHRMYDASNPPAGQFADPNAPYAGNGQVYLSTEDTRMRGPFSDAMPFGHQAVGDPLFLSSALCGQCHDVTNPVRNRRDAATGADLGYRMPIERTWTEYSRSRIGDPTALEFRTCQQCHMPEPDLDGDTMPDPAYACQQIPGLRGQGTALEGPMREHWFAGANAWMLSVLREQHADGLNRRINFDESIAETLNVLTRAVDASVAAPAVVDAGDAAPVGVRVTNLTGHKFPTGYPEGRRAWIGLTAGPDLDASGSLSDAEVAFRSAAYDAATGVLDHDAQAVVYEAKLGIFDHDGTGRCDTVDDATGREMFHFVLNDCIVQDNRIPPLGFVPNPETEPVGRTYPENVALPGTLANWDDRAYVVPVPIDAGGRWLVEARVFYQTTSKEYVEFLRDESVSTCDPHDAGCDPTLADARPNRGEKMHALWEQHGRAAPIEIAFARGAFDVTPAPPEACCVAGGCLDLTPAECAAREGELLAGELCPAPACPPPAPPPGEPSDVLAGDEPLRVTKAGGTALALTYAPACDATDHAVAWGALPGVRTHAWTRIACGLGTSGAAAVDPGAGSVFLVVVGKSPNAEGSYGRESDGDERPSRVGTSPCDAPQDLGATCR